MKGRLCVQMFSFDQPFQSYQKDDFAKVKLINCKLLCYTSVRKFKCANIMCIKWQLFL